MTTDHRRTELRDFLRSRRARLSPADVGLPPGDRRRTPGLRREEVAVLANVGVSWYTWLEQGRDIKVSGTVLDAIARALRLDATERRHLYLLAGLPAPAEPAGPARPVPPELRRLLDSWLPNPAYVMDRHWNFIATNRAAAEVFGYGDHVNNCLVSFFTNGGTCTPESRRAAAEDMVGMFRAASAYHPGDPEFARLAADLARVSPEFAEIWERHDVREPMNGRKVVQHPDAGDLTFEYSRLPVPGRPGEFLILHTPVPGTGTAERLEALIAGMRDGYAAAGGR